MRPLPVLVFLAALVAGFGSGQVNSVTSTARTAQIPVLRPTVVARFPHSVTAFTEGLQYLGNDMYIESTGSVAGSSASGVRRMNLKTGDTLREVVTPLAGAFGEGVTVLGGLAYHLTWQDGAAFSFSLPNLRQAGQFKYSGEGWGLTNDGKQLIMSNGTPTLVWRDPRTFAVTRSVTVTAAGQPVKNLNELEWVQGSIYANIWLTDRMARIDPQTGKVTAWIDLSLLSQEAGETAKKAGRPLTFDDVANGIAYHPQHGTLLLTGKRWPTLFEVKLDGVSVGK